MLSAEDRKALIRIKKRGRAETVPVALDEYVKAGRTKPDGQGGYIVEYYVISEKGEEYLKQSREKAKTAFKRFFVTASKFIIWAGSFLVALAGLLIFFQVVYLYATGKAGSCSFGEVLLLAVKSMKELTIPSTLPAP